MSVDGGSNPAWNPHDKELFFVGPRNKAGKRSMMVVDLDAASSLHIGALRPLFEFDSSDLALYCGPVRCYDVAPDGQRFYAIQHVPPSPAPPVTHINLILNWFEVLKATVPVKR